MDSKCFCRINELNKAISQLENNLTEQYNLSFNEAMVMCSLSAGRRSAGEIAEETGIKSSHLSKVLRSIEDKSLLTREFGEEDKRVIYFALTSEGTQRLENLKSKGPEMPELLRSFMTSWQNER